MKDLDRQVLAGLPEDLLLLLLDDLPGPVMGIDDVVTDGEIDALGLASDVEGFDRLVLGGSGLGWDGVLLNRGVRVPDDMSCLQIAVHEVDLLQPAKALADVLRPNFSDSLH
jgi:hypothetical protein